jgi:2-amino-4-hydroxy-6-hydroxymethyldihydropteridine diphosphokinase
MLRRFYLSLGSNLGDREANLTRAVDGLRELGQVAAVSSFYETEPVELVDQPWFLNCAIALDTALTPFELLPAILTLEQDMGRQRTRKKGPRTIDIDILLAADAVVDTPELTVPHPAMHERQFVLEPLAEIAPDALHPRTGKKISQLRDDLPPGKAVKRLPGAARGPTRAG